jgi:uncharacterized protein YceK
MLANGPVSCRIGRQLVWFKLVDMLSSAASSELVIWYRHSPKRLTMKAALRSIVLAFAALSLSGCASIVSGRHADVAIDSYPSHAHVEIHDKYGRQVSSLQTPGVATLKRQGKYFLPAKYTATITAPGYAPAQVPIRSTVNPWVLGNVVIGGVAGLVVDSATGAGWKPKHSEIHQELIPLAGDGPFEPYSDSIEPQPVEPAEYVAEEAADESAELE